MEKRNFYIVNFEEIDSGSTDFLMELTESEVNLLYYLDNTLELFSVSVHLTETFNPEGLLDITKQS